MTRSSWRLSRARAGTGRRPACRAWVCMLDCDGMVRMAGIVGVYVDACVHVRIYIVRVYKHDNVL